MSPVELALDCWKAEHGDPRERYRDRIRRLTEYVTAERAAILAELPPPPPGWHWTLDADAYPWDSPPDFRLNLRVGEKR